MGLMTVILLFMGSVIAAVVVLFWYRKRTLLHFAIPAAALVSAGLFISAVFRWDIVGHEYFLLPIIAAIGVVGTLAFVYQSGNIAKLPRKSLRHNIVLLVLTALPFALPASLYIEFGEVPEAVDLTFPLPEGHWYIAQGGNALVLNHHRRVWAQRYALDLTALGGDGRRTAEKGNVELSNYHAYGAYVYAPCSGRVVAGEDGHAEVAAGESVRDNPAGNFAAIHCDHQETTVFLAHLQPGLSVNVGERVRGGDIVGRVGNSGRTSEPHLHIHAVAGRHSALADLLFKAQGLPMRFGGQVLIRNDVFEVTY